MLFPLIFPRAQRASTYDISAERNVWLQSALRSFAIVCDYMETGLFAIVCDLRSAIVCDPRSSAIVCDHMETSLQGGGSPFYPSQLPVSHVKAGFHMIADDRGSQIAESSAIVCDHMETHFCDRLRFCDDDRRRSQKIEPCSIFCDHLRSSAIICDRLRSCDHMETKVLRSAIEMYSIIFLILTDDSTFLGHKARMFDYSNAHLL